MKMRGIPDVEKIWLKSYPEGMPAEVPKPEHRSLRDLFEHSFREFPDNRAFTCMGRTLSYRELDMLSGQFACYLQKSLGLTRGERVALMMPNVLQYAIAL